MYFFNDKKLARDLYKGIVTEKQQMLYLLITFSLYTLMSLGTVNFFIWSSIQYLTAFDYIVDALIITVTISIIIASYIINTKGDNKEFIARNICLCIPIGFRMIFVLFFMLIPIFAYSMYTGPSLEELEAMPPDAQIDMTTVELFLYTFSLILAYTYGLYRYITCFKIASGQKEYE